MSKQPRMGRPPKAPEDRASDAFHFRVRSDYGELIRRAAEGSGQSVSGWIRDRVLKAAREEVQNK